MAGEVEVQVLAVDLTSPTGRVDRIFDRDVEWGYLTAFAERSPDRPRLGVVCRPRPGLRPRPGRR